MTAGRKDIRIKKEISGFTYRLILYYNVRDGYPPLALQKQTALRRRTGDSRRADVPGAQEGRFRTRAPFGGFPFGAGRRASGALTALLLKTATSILQ